MPRSLRIAAIEAGTSKIAVVIGECTPGRELRLLGLAQAASEGISKGSLVDLRAAGDCIQRALDAAERSAGSRPDRAFLAITGSHIEGFLHDAACTVGTVDGTVSRDDIATVRRLAASRQLPANRVVIEHLPGPLFLDGRLVDAPEHLSGRRLTTECWTLHGDEGRTASLLRLVQGFRLRVSRLTGSGVASGAAITTREERQAGALALDMGAGCTDYALYRHGAVRAAGALALGGDHLTNDLALALHLPQDEAETVKKLHGRALVSCRDRSRRIWPRGAPCIGNRPLPLWTIETVTAARLGELFEVIKQKLGDACTPENIPAGVLLTGAAAQLPACEEVATRVFGAAARHGEPPAWVAAPLRQPEFSTALGLLIHGFHAPDHAPGQKRRGSLFRRLFGDLFY